VTYVHPDSAKLAAAADAGAGVASWVESTMGTDEHALYVRNVSDRQVHVVSYEIYECFNLRGKACGVHSLGLVLKPGESKRLTIIEGGDRRHGRASYKYRVRAVYVVSDTAAAK